MYEPICGKKARKNKVRAKPPPQREEKSLLEELVDDVTDTADDLLP